MRRFRCSRFALALSFLFVACSTAQPAADHEVVDEEPPEQEQRFEVDTTGWSQERLELEERFQAWLMSGESLAEAMAQGPAQLRVVAEEKADGQQELERQLLVFYEGDEDRDVKGWATTRIAQTYLNFACELDEMGAPEGLTDDQVQAYRQSIQDMVAPLISQTTSWLGTIEDQNIPVWTEKAQFIAGEIDPFTAESCAATGEFWLPEGRPTPEERRN